jgi:monofunctional biosynthetic peptidoglycan transglycosylase
MFGIEMASRKYYGKSAAELNPEESSRLAAVLPNPRKYAPTRESRYVTQRSRLIYNIMLRRGIVVPKYKEFVDEVEEETAVDSEPQMKPPPEIQEIQTQ